MSRLRVPVTGDDHILGPAKAAVTLVEYGDYQCPFCGEAFWVLRDMRERFGDLRFVFRNFPLTEIHPCAMIAAEAAEAASTQGLFWEMHDLIYENQRELSPEQLVEHASSLNLDIDEFTAELETHRYAERIKADFMGGVRSGVNGTPTLFINGERYNGPVDATLLGRALDDARHGRQPAVP